MYDARTYWSDRSLWLKDPKPRFEDPGELDNVANWIQEIQPKEILEVGCGHGRIYERLKPFGLADAFLMCDFVENMLDGCEKRTGVRPDLWDGVRLPYDDGAFDLVLSFSVLLHAPHFNIVRLFSEHVRVARRWLFIATCTKGIHPESRNAFGHDYKGLFSRAPFEVVKERVFRGSGQEDWERTHWLLERS